MEWINNKTILTAQKYGFLENGYTHTLNPYSGCSFAGTLCGKYCYAQHQTFTPNRNKRAWGLYGAKKNAVTAYIKQYQSLKFPKRKSTPIKPLKIYMSSATDPYVPQEKTTEITRGLLETMLTYPPDVLVLQTRNPLIIRDIDIIKSLSERTSVWVSITVETDKEQVEGLPRHSFSPRQRLETAQIFKAKGIPIQITVSPLMPLDNLEQFTKDVDSSCDRVILDHYLLGDGSKNGLRTKRTNIPKILADNGYEKWLELETFYEVAAYMGTILGNDRVLISSEGFNAI